MKIQKLTSHVKAHLSILSLTGVGGTHQHFIQRDTTMAHRYYTLLAHLHLLLMLPTYYLPTICTTSRQVLTTIANAACLRIQPCCLFDLGIKHSGHSDS